MNRWISFAHDDGGATAIEYALIASLMIIVSLAAFGMFGHAVSSKYSYVESNVSNAGEP